MRTSMKGDLLKRYAVGVGAKRGAAPLAKSTTIKPRSFLRWAGSKRKIVRRLASFWKPEYRRYVEPFAGSSCLFFEVQPTRALLSDKNQELIDTYRALCRRPADLHAGVSALQDDETTYYRVRAEDPSDLTQFERGVRFVYLNRYCFNGLYRTNCRGQFNVPYGRSRTGALPPVEQFLACARLLARAELRAWDFGTALRYVQEGDFVYLDPPYAVRTRRVFREYGPKSFSSGDLERLAWHLEKLDAKGARFLLSYAYCGDAKRLFDRWRVTRVTTRRHIAGFAGARRNTYEMLVTNA